MQAPPTAIRGLYIHVPFCFHKCHYCDFYSIAADPQKQGGDFVDRLIQELKFRAQQWPVKPLTVFIGGGTPTYLPVEHLERLLNAMHDLRLLQETSEFTVEANPETLSRPVAELLAGAGVNRLSIGAQSFDPGLLKTLERWHDPQNVAKSVDTARDAGIRNINLDLIFAIPGQTCQLLDSDLQQAMSLNPDHLSYYNLTYEPATALTQRLEMGLIDPVEQETERQMYQRLMDCLDALGYGHYEISNWAKPDRQCLHNLNYWDNGNWLGVGPSAASHIDGVRWKNQAHLGQYLSQGPQPPISDVEQLDADRYVGEQLMLKLRLRQGVQLEWLRAQISDDNPRWATIEQLIDQDLLQRKQGYLQLSAQGLFLADAIIAKLL